MELQWHLGVKMTSKKILKYGAIASLGAGFGGAFAGAAGAQIGFKKEAAKDAGIAAAFSGAAVTGLVLGRKHLAKGAVAAGKSLGKSVLNGTRVIFRRIGGRIVPIKVKK